MANQNVVTMTDDNFQAETIESDVPVLVDFFAEWCGPCKMMAPHVDDLAESLQGKLKVGKLDIDHNPQTPTKYGISGVPTLLLFKGGQLVNQQVGAISKGALKSFVDPVL